MNFSIVIPLYNKANHIQRAINSVLGQTVQDFELIIVDDGSTDKSFEAASAIQDPRIRIIRQENRGVSAARNRGIMEAQNEWIAFLDADDEWLPGFLGEIVCLVNLYPQCAVAGTGYYQVDPLREVFVNPVSMPISLGWRGIIENYFNAIDASYPFNSSSFAAKKSALIQAGLYPEGVAISEDPSLYLQLALNHKFAFSYLPLSIYHRDAENRAWTGFGMEQLHVVKVGKEILNTTDIEQSIKNSLYEFLVRVELGRARTLLYFGRNKEALEVLTFCSHSHQTARVKKYVKWAKAPRYLFRLTFSIKDRIKQLLAVFEEIT